MAIPAAVPAGRPTLSIRGTSYPVLLPTLGDPRLHLAAVIISLQVLGQTAFDFDVSIAQILIAVGTCAVLEIGIAFRTQRAIMWPASALLTGNGVAFVLRVPGTVHGDWWSTNGWWIFAGTAAVSLLSKYLIKWRGNHVFNPSNFGLVLCFLILGKERAEPLDFWWGPMSAWMALALAIIVAGGFAILLRLRLIGLALAFWVTFAAGMAVIAGGGHDMTARWHLGPVTGRYFWWVLITSPEVLVFMFFMITDPKTTPKGRQARIVYGAGIGLLATLLIAPMRTEFGAKVALLGSLAIVCAARPVIEWMLPVPGSSDDRVSAWASAIAARGRAGMARLGALGLASVAAFAGLVVLAGIPARPGPASAAPLADVGRLPRIKILDSPGVSTQLDDKTSRLIATSLIADLKDQATALRTRRPKVAETGSCCGALTDVQTRVAAAKTQAILVRTYRLDRMTVKLIPAQGQAEPVALAAVIGQTQDTSWGGTPPRVIHRNAPVAFTGTFQLDRGTRGYEVRTPMAVGAGTGASPPAASAPAPAVVTASSFNGVHLHDVASQVGLDFSQDDFRYGITPSDVHSMMGGGLCWIDYNNDGWLDLFVVNSYSDNDTTTWNAHGGLPRSALYENVHGKFVDVSAKSHADIAVQGNGCVAADFNGDGYTDLLITTNTYNVLLWNNGNGTFTDGTHAAGIDAFGTYGWHTGAAVADVNGDGRPDIFVSGYANVNGSTNSPGGFPSNYQAYPDLLYLNEGPDAHGHSRFKDVAVKAGIDVKGTDHSLGAVFADVNGDGRPDLYVANDLDPNRLYVNEPGGPLGFHFVDEGSTLGVADTNAGMGVAAQDFSGDGRPDFFVTNSRGQGHAAYRSEIGRAFDNVQPTFKPGLGVNGTGWGDSWVDLDNDGRLDLVIANGAIPVTNLKKDAGPIQVLENVGGRFENASAAVGLDPGPLVNGRGLAAADYDNDGRVDVAVNSIGGKLILLHNTGGTGHWLEVGLKKFSPGAMVAVRVGGQVFDRWIEAGSSYLSSEGPRAYFGLGKTTKIDEVRVFAADGKLLARRKNVAADQILTLP
jgi:hypothetical protein